MILSDRDIEDELNFGRIRISPLPADDAFQPASVEVTLQDAHTRGAREYTQIPDMGGNATWYLRPGEFALGETVEEISIPGTLCAQVNGKSSLGRLGLLVHATAGFIDPGFRGSITLEFKNLGEETIILTRGMRIAQLVFHRLSSPVKRPYGHEGLGSHYQDQVGVTRSYLAS